MSFETFILSIAIIVISFCLLQIVLLVSLSPFDKIAESLNNLAKTYEKIEFIEDEKLNTVFPFIFNDHRKYLEAVRYFLELVKEDPNSYAIEPLKDLLKFPSEDPNEIMARAKDILGDKKDEVDD